MDRTKFRFWDTNENVMIDWETAMQTAFNGGRGDNYYSLLYRLFRNLDIIKEQCTGLRDKSGKLIYEGDIIKYGSKTFKVIFNQGIASFTVELSKAPKWYPCVNKGTMESAEVIGNIHQNPELLESEGNNA